MPSDVSVRVEYFTVAQVARILGWTWHKTNRWLRSGGALVQRCGQNVVTRDSLKLAFPEAYSSLLESEYDPDDDDMR